MRLSHMRVSTLISFLFVEHCRGCTTLLSLNNLSPATTVCLNCWNILCNQKPFLEHYKISTRHSLLISSAVPYKDLARKLLFKFKYGGDRKLGEDLSILLSTLWQLQLLKTSNPALVPVPLHWKRILIRGFNQSEILAHVLSTTLKIETLPKALVRKRATHPQHKLGQLARFSNLHGAFSANHQLIKNRELVLVDDIYTSGATLSECARVLLDAGALSVSAMTIARAVYR